MQYFVDLFSKLYDVELLIQTIGYGGMAAIVFVETGLLVGFFLPGDSLLFTAGVACVPGNAILKTHHLDIVTLNLFLVPAAILGDTVGYWIGYKAGLKMYQREKTFFFRKDHLLHAKAFYEEHGGKTIVIARFVPMLRTFAPVVAGIAQMPYRRFIAFNVVGAFGWITGLSTIGYLLGNQPIVKNNLKLTIMLIIFVSLLPAIITVLKAKYGKAPAISPKENGAHGVGGAGVLARQSPTAAGEDARPTQATPEDAVPTGDNAP